MSEEIIKAIDKLAEKFGIVIDWANGNVMPYVQDLCGRIIKFDTATTIIELITLIVLSITFGLLTMWTIKKYKEEDRKRDWDSKEELYMILGIAFGICFAVTIIFTIVLLPIGISHIVQNQYLPEATIIEYITELL